MSRLTLALVVTACLAGEAVADPPVRELTAAADRHFDLGEYDAAIAKYRDAYRIEPLPGLLYNLGQAYRLKGDCLTATRMYKNFLRIDPATRHRALVEQHLEALARCAAEREAAGGTAAATEGSEDADAGRSPPGTSLGGATAAERPPPRRAERPGGRRRLAGLTAAATGAVAIAAGGYFALDASRAADEVSRGYAEGAAWSELDALDARGRRSEILGVSLLATGAAALACGATLYSLGWRADRRAAHAAIVPAAGGASVEVTWRF